MKQTASDSTMSKSALSTAANVGSGAKGARGGVINTGKMNTPSRRTNNATGANKPSTVRSNDAHAMNAQAGPTVTARELAKWQKVQAQLRAQLGHDSYQSWFGRCRLETISKSQLSLSVPTTFLKTWIRNHYHARLLELWQDNVETILRVDIVVRSAVRSANSENGAATDLHPRPAQQAERPSSDVNHHPALAKAGSAFSKSGYSALPPSTRELSSAHSNDSGASGQAGFGISGGQGRASGRGAGETGGSFAGSPLDPNFTFSTFVEGPSNRMAAAAARSVAEADGAAARFNPLFIHANVGLGKTHLLQAIAWAAAERQSGIKILYLTAEYFMWRFASAIRDQSALSFKESLRDIDLLLIDDMQFLQGKSIQQEFCHLLNALIDSAKQVVVAADRPPAQLESLDARVRSRLKGGVALEVKSPDLDMRQTMLDLRYRDAQRDDPNLDIPRDILEFVAGKVASSGRDLEGAFNQILVQHRFSEGPIDMDAIEKMLSHLVQSSEQRRVRIEDIQKVAARHYNVSKNDLLSNRRTRVIVRPRQIAMYLSKILTPRSLPEIGRRFGGRDHTTVLHAVRKIEGLLKEDEKLAHEVELLKRLIHEMGQ